MADVTISLSNATKEEQDAAQWVLDRVNSERTEKGLAAFATVEEFLANLLQDQVFPSYVAQYLEANLRDNWANATLEQKQAALSALGK